MNEIIGLIPAAGIARRLAPLPCSKELLPIGVSKVEKNGTIEIRPKPVASYILESMAVAGIHRVLMVISKEKWDIPRFFGNGSDFGMSISYLIQENQLGMPDALNQAYPWLCDETVVFGMPDTIIRPTNVFQSLIEDHFKRQADITLGLFPTDKPQKFGMVAYDQNQRMTYSIDKPEQTDLKYMWGMGCWSPKFTHFLRDQLSKVTSNGKEIVLADIFQQALHAGMDINVIPFKEGKYYDIGTLDDLYTVMRIFT
jgi:glucose-1-phosphate thymidylyltransferase